MTSVAPLMPCSPSTSDAARFSVRIWAIAASRSASDVRPERRPLTRNPVPSRLVSSRTSPGRAPPLRNSRSGWAAPITARPYLGSGSRIVWPPARTPPASRTLDDGRLEHGRERVAREVLGKGRDRQREQHPAAHREHVGQGVGGGDLAVRDRVVDERRKEVERAEDREVVGDPVGGGVIGRLEAGDQRVVVARRPPRGPTARRPAGPRRASRHSRRSRSGRSGGSAGAVLEHGHRPILGSRPRANADIDVNVKVGYDRDP